MFLISACQFMPPHPGFFGYLADSKETAAFLCWIKSSGHLAIAFWHRYADFCAAPLQNVQHKKGADFKVYRAGMKGGGVWRRRGLK